MRALWMFLKALLVLMVAVIGAMFAMENSQQVAVNFFLIQTSSLSLGLWLLIFLAVGCLLGLLASSLMISSYRRKLARVSHTRKEGQSVKPIEQRESATV